MIQVTSPKVKHKTDIPAKMPDVYTKEALKRTPIHTYH